ncbi:hypothetical protein TNCV_4440361 [Trichonephila clavipes]|nr:hypothetical protein TNCV_4440361 [Trichonephila clavipes]
MDTPKEEPRCVVRCLTAEGVSQPEISRRMTTVYGEHHISLANVMCLSKQFRKGHECCVPTPGIITHKVMCVPLTCVRGATTQLSLKGGLTVTFFSLFLPLLTWLSASPVVRAREKY